MNALLEINGLSGGYVRCEDNKVLHDITMTIGMGEVVGVIGKNGSGKSTLAKAIMNLLPYRSGEIHFEGKDVSKKSTHELAGLGIALMHQGGTVFPNLSIWQNLELAWGKDYDEDYRHQLEGMVTLLSRTKSTLRQTKADRLSGGERLELALTMTLARRPKLAILDEPSAGLSPKTLMETYDRLAQIRDTFGMAMMIIEQNIARAHQSCDRCLVLDLGKITANLDRNTTFETIESLMF
jgi:ABC-type branched-subunit amino acid transport system ATPase component